MDEMTPLDAAHAAMTAAPDDETARRRYYARLVAGELFLLLEAEAEGARICPRLFEVGGQSYALAFDTDARLAAFVGAAAPYAGLPGRVAAQMLAASGLGMGVNLEVAPSALLLPPDAVAWLAETVAPDLPEPAESRLGAVYPPAGLSGDLLGALDARLAATAGLAEAAYLVAATFQSGARGYLLGLVGAVPGAEAALARAVADALRVSGSGDVPLDVGFFQADAAATERLARVGLRFDLPRPAAPSAAPAAASIPPGTDPSQPPRLK